jgi:hypothetical protein
LFPLAFLFFLFFGVSIGFEVSWGLRLIYLSTYSGGSNDLPICTYPQT